MSRQLKRMMVALSLLIALPWGGCATTQATHRETSHATSSPRVKADISQVWRGQVYVPQNALRDDVKTPPVELLVIRDEKRFNAFLVLIPKKVISKRQPALPTGDPFVRGKRIDFTRYSLLVTLRTANMYARAPITSVTRRGDGWVAKVQVPPLGDTKMLASMAGIGTYYAVTVPKLTGPVVMSTK